MRNFLDQTYTNPNFFNVKDADKVNSIFGEEELEKNENWKNLGPVLHEAMLVKSF